MVRREITPLRYYLALLTIMLLFGGSIGFRSHSLLPRCIVSSRRAINVRMTSSSTSQTNDRSAFFSQKSFASIGVNPKMEKVLSSIQITRPSKIQAIAFPSVYQGKHCIIGDQTGSGKTLAYMLPVVQRMDELYANGTLRRPRERSPYIVVLTPTTELAS